MILDANALSAYLGQNAEAIEIVSDGTPWRTHLGGIGSGAWCDFQIHEAHGRTHFDGAAMFAFLAAEPARAQIGA